MALKFITAEEAATFVHHNDNVGFSGFTPAGCPKVVSSAIAKKAIAEMFRQVGKPQFFKNGIMKKGVIIRHLLLPQGTKEAMSVFDWVKENANSVYFSIMSQYLPLGKAKEMPIINRPVTKREYEKVLNYISESDFEKVFTQNLKSAKEEYVPLWNLEGV